MSANALLLWMSARSQGSWQQFRAAVEELHLESSQPAGEDDDSADQLALPLYQTLRLNMQRLGHAEFFAGADNADWKVTPPSLALTRQAHSWLGVLVGARSAALLHRFHATQIASSIETKLFPACPDQLLIASDDLTALESVAEATGLSVQRDAPAALLASLPPVDHPGVRIRAQLPFGGGWKVDRYSPDDLQWRSATFDDATRASGSLFRFAFRHQRYVLYCERGSAFHIPGQVGKYLALKRRRRQVLRYDAETRLLSAPASCRPPFLVERALILCSGTLPAYDGEARGGILRYSAIPDRIASLVAALLRQEFR